MARVFSITFTFKERKYVAVISQTAATMNILVPDATLHHLLHQGKFSLDLQEGLQIDTPKLSETQHLVLTILSALEQQSTTKSKLNARK